MIEADRRKARKPAISVRSSDHSQCRVNKSEVSFMAEKLVVLVSKDRGPRSEHERIEKRIVRELSRREDVVVILSPHLYDLAMEGPGVDLLRSVPGDMIVLAWLYPRAAYWLLDAHEVRGRLGPTSSLPEEDMDRPAAEQSDDQPKRTIWCFDLRRYEKPERLLEEIDEILTSASFPSQLESVLGANGQARQVEEHTRPRWYPVIDYQRCNNCLECLNFCLFGVFSLDEDNSILIEQPDACRPGCPACSRICPEGAIMFPQHKDPGIAGDPKASRGGLKLDLSQLFGGQTPAELAAAERDRALAERKTNHAAPVDKPADKDELDQLIDKLDESDL
jgi:NAD-dependent dihydropyrimidine dehydrogenase PreA subunit